MITSAASGGRGQRAEYQHQPPHVGAEQGRGKELEATYQLFIFSKSYELIH